ncbi:hypothetical protein E5161_11020 [Cohnella pontilimi]|uniref:CorA-like Mg2+ transporter protein n=1 Tax=Cohnella pontilimi TaxID=2564100 RepID=A0A4U0FAI0_9BACL|nr:hypothetical protein [Cohnella pontilimi]TJY41737.1 hypothetical protein E5161_11020 [Cohnella pontilimi]
MKTPAIEPQPVREVLFQFVFPFSLEHECQNELREKLLQDGFIPFRLGDTELEDRFYGGRHRVSHPDMERYYLPFTNQVLFPAEDNVEAFRRLSKSLGMKAQLVSRQRRASFIIHSVDLFLCPFDTGFLTLRTELDTYNGITLSESIAFADRFRSLQDANRQDRETFVEYEGTMYEEIDQFLFQEIVPQLLVYLDQTPMAGSYFEELPFLMDERMFVLAFYRFPSEVEISLLDRYRAARLDGFDADGNPAISASHLPYIRDYCRRYGYDRWAPYTYFFTDENCFCCLTRESRDHAAVWVSRWYGEYYYGLLLNLFHRIVLLKLSNAYSRVQVERKELHTVELIRDITTFAAKYNFVEVVAQSHGREIFQRLRQIYGNDELFIDVKQTLSDLYQYQESRRQHQSGYLLTILTIYTVISGIYGMNQVIDDLKTPIRWSNMSSYSPFEWIALLVTFSGLIVAFMLVFDTVRKWSIDFIRRKRK